MEEGKVKNHAREDFTGQSWKSHITLSSTIHWAECLGTLINVFFSVSPWAGDRLYHHLVNLHCTGMLRLWLSWSVHAHTSLFSSPFTLLILPYSYIIQLKDLKETQYGVMPMLWGSGWSVYEYILNQPVRPQHAPSNPRTWYLEAAMGRLVIGEHSLIHSTEEGKNLLPCALTVVYPLLFKEWIPSVRRTNNIWEFVQNAAFQAPAQLDGIRNP